MQMFMFFMLLCKQSSRWKDVLDTVSSTSFHLLDVVRTACTNGLPDDEHMIFEMRRRHQELNCNFNLRSVPFGGLHYIIVSQFTVQKHKENINISIYIYMPSNSTNY